MMITWKYTIPAFVVPFAFTLAPEGMGLLLRAPSGTVAWSFLTAALGVAALAYGAGGWLKQAANPVERVMAIASGLLLIYPRSSADAFGAVVLAVSIGLHLWRVRSAAISRNN
jgi:TRAP-type uncharacterized transport system fused permease subunit